MPRHVCQCAHGDVLTLLADARWPEGVELTWYIEEETVPDSFQAFVAIAVAAGISIWPRRLNITTRQVFDPREARLVVYFGPIDGPEGILGQTQLPTSVAPNSQLTMQLDSAEPWTRDYLRRVVSHEFGHFLGVGHAYQTKALMDPYYDPFVDDLLPWDVAQGTERYGPAKAPQPPANVRAQTYTGTFHADEAGPCPVNLTDFVAPAPGDYRVTIEPVT